MISLGSSEALSNTSSNPRAALFTPKHISARSLIQNSVVHSPLDKSYFSCVLSLRTRWTPDFLRQHPSRPCSPSLAILTRGLLDRNSLVKEYSSPLSHCELRGEPPEGRWAKPQTWVKELRVELERSVKRDFKVQLWSILSQMGMLSGTWGPGQVAEVTISWSGEQEN